MLPLSTLPQPVTTSFRAFTAYVLLGITNKALELVLAAVKPGADVYDLCRLGDDFIEEQTGKLYNKKVRGIFRLTV